jgi:hypothetical protein
VTPARLTRAAYLPPTNGQPDTRTGTEIILDFFRERYLPDFRRGNAIHAADGEMVYQSVACAAPTSVLIARLEAATDAPRFSEASGGGVKRDALPFFFRKWSPVAWGDMLAELPDETEAALGMDSVAADQFRAMVRDALLSEIQFGDVIRGTNVTQVERRSLIDWCVKWSKPGPWRSIRSKKCWCKIEVKAAGRIVLRVAVRRDLFPQVRADKFLCGLTQNGFARLAARYGIGSSHRDDRPHGLAAVVLEDAFVAELTAGMYDPENLVESDLPTTADGPDQKPTPSEWTDLL